VSKIDRDLEVLGVAFEEGLEWAYLHALLLVKRSRRPTPVWVIDAAIARESGERPPGQGRRAPAQAWFEQLEHEKRWQWLSACRTTQANRVMHHAMLERNVLHLAPEARAARLRGLDRLGTTWVQARRAASVILYGTEAKATTVSTSYGRVQRARERRQARHPHLGRLLPAPLLIATPKPEVRRVPLLELLGNAPPSDAAE
jgi:hypothetical protein